MSEKEKWQEYDRKKLEIWDTSDSYDEARKRIEDLIKKLEL